MATYRSRLLAFRFTLSAALISPAPALLAQAGSPSLVSVTFSPATIAGGGTATATITLSAPAGNSGVDVSLSLTSPVAQLSSNAVSVGNGLLSTRVPIATIR